MFQSEFQHSLDAKGRLILPMRIREELGEKFILTKGLDGCLYIYPLKEWEEFSERLNQLPTSSKQARRLIRHFIGSSVVCEPDKQGRFLISAVLRDFSKIEKEVTILGVSDHIEIWSTECYEEYQNDEDVSIEDIAGELDF